MPWTRVVLVVEGAVAEALCETLEGAGAVASEMTDADAGTEREQAAFGEPGAEVTPWPRCRVTALFPEALDVSSALESAMQASGIRCLEGATLDRLEDADWVALTQRQFEPIRVGERLWIVPTWHVAPDPNAVNITLDPGAAFGTGSHPTTRLCLGWLEREVRAGDRVLDYGCGSGILAIAALMLGAGSAVGVDVDPLALQTAGYNASRNGVVLEVRDAHRAGAVDARITVANILANPLRMLAPIIASHTVAHGRIALSGILEDQAADVVEAYARWARLEVTGREGGWVLLAGDRLG